MSARRAIIERVFVHCPPPAPLNDDELDGLRALNVDSEMVNRDKEYEEIMELKTMVKMGGLGLSPLSLHPAHTSNGVRDGIAITVLGVGIAPLSSSGPTSMEI